MFQVEGESSTNGFEQLCAQLRAAKLWYIVDVCLTEDDDNTLQSLVEWRKEDILELMDDINKDNHNPYHIKVSQKNKFARMVSQFKPVPQTKKNHTHDERQIASLEEQVLRLKVENEKLKKVTLEKKEPKKTKATKTKKEPKKTKKVTRTKVDPSNDFDSSRAHYRITPVPRKRTFGARFAFKTKSEPDCNKENILCIDSEPAKKDDVDENPGNENPGSDENTDHGSFNLLQLAYNPDTPLRSESLESVETPFFSAKDFTTANGNGASSLTSPILSPNSAKPFAFSWNSSD